MLVLLAAVVTGAWAQEQSETIATTDYIVEGTHFTISTSEDYSFADEEGMCADWGITVTSKNGETITKVVISCTLGPEDVNVGNTSVSSGTKEITNGGGTITVTGVNASTFTFTCSEPGPQFGQFVVYYTEAPATVAVTGVTLAPTSATLTLGETETVTLTATVLPGDATDKSVTWSSSDETVATVGNDGVVTAVAPGTATITVTTTDGAKTATCAVTVAAPAASTYTVTMKESTDDATSWQGKAGEGTYQQLPLEGVAQGAQVSLKYGGALKVKSVKAKKAAPAGPTYNETKSINDGPVTVAAGEQWLITGTGTQTSNTMSIGAGATVTLDGVNISSGDYCIKCLGDATIILKDGSTNTLTGTGENCPALWIGDANTTLTIQGNTGVLNVTSGEYCAGIGGGYANTNNTCGNIRIEGGVITAQGGNSGAGIGSDSNPATCGDIIITGGTVTATGGTYAAGIGTGNGDQNVASCGSITITNGVTKVTAAKGAYAPNSIGKGNGSNASCGTVTIGGTGYGTDGVSTSPYTYQPSN